MSIARVHHVSRANKDQGECERCKTKLPKGSAYRWYQIGFRARYKHKRCMASACTPKPSELESSKLADVYAAQEAFDSDLAQAGSKEDVEGALSALAEAVRDVASEYEEASTNEYGTVFNVDAEERAANLENAADEYENISLDQFDCEECTGEGSVECDNCNGTGEAECDTCGGSGVIDDGESEEPCPDCDGSGQDSCDECSEGKKQCETCDGTGFDIDNVRDAIAEEVGNVDLGC